MKRFRDLALGGAIQNGDFNELIELLLSGNEIPPATRETLAELLDERSDHHLQLRLIQKKKGRKPKQVDSKFIFVVALTRALIGDGWKKEAAIAETCRKLRVSRSTVFEMIGRYDNMIAGYMEWEKEQSEKMGE